MLSSSVKIFYGMEINLYEIKKLCKIVSENDKNLKKKIEKCAFPKDYLNALRNKYYKDIEIKFATLKNKKICLVVHEVYNKTSGVHECDIKDISDKKMETVEELFLDLGRKTSGYVKTYLETYPQIVNNDQLYIDHSYKSIEEENYEDEEFEELEEEEEEVIEIKAPAPQPQKNKVEKKSDNDDYKIRNDVKKPILAVSDSDDSDDSNDSDESVSSKEYERVCKCTNVCKKCGADYYNAVALWYNRINAKNKSKQNQYVGKYSTFDGSFEDVEESFDNNKFNETKFNKFYEMAEQNKPYEY